MNDVVQVREERWRPVPGYQGWYEVSDLGQVYSLSRAATRGGLLTPQLNSAGYRFVRLHKYGRVRTRTVGSLVLETFRGQPASPGARARHGPGGRLDDSLLNLRWGLNGQRDAYGSQQLRHDLEHGHHRHENVLSARFLLTLSLRCQPRTRNSGGGVSRHGPGRAGSASRAGMGGSEAAWTVGERRAVLTGAG